MEPLFKLVALIPAYNEGEKIRQVVESTKPYVDRVVVCDDGSSDDIQTVLCTVDVDMIHHSSNLGYGAALKSLFKHGKEINATVVVCVDVARAQTVVSKGYPPKIARAFFGDVGVVVGPILMGFIADNSNLYMPFYVTTGIILINVILVQIFAKETYSRKQIIAKSKNPD